MAVSVDMVADCAVVAVAPPLTVHMVAAGRTGVGTHSTLITTEEQNMFMFTVHMVAAGWTGVGTHSTLIIVKQDLFMFTVHMVTARWTAHTQHPEHNRGTKYFYVCLTHKIPTEYRAD